MGGERADGSERGESRERGNYPPSKYGIRLGYQHIARRDESIKQHHRGCTKHVNLFEPAMTMKRGLILLAAATIALASVRTSHAVNIVTTIPGSADASNPSSDSPSAFHCRLYQYALGIAGILAFGIIVYGGVRYMTSVGNPGPHGREGVDRGGTSRDRASCRCISHPQYHQPEPRAARAAPAPDVRNAGGGIQQ